MTSSMITTRLSGKAAAVLDREGAAYVALARHRAEMALRRVFVGGESANQPRPRDRRPNGWPGRTVPPGCSGARNSRVQCSGTGTSRSASARTSAADPVHPAPERAGDMGAVAMLQPENKTTGVFIVAQHRACPVPTSLLPAQSPHIASSPIGCANGRPQAAHQGGAKNVMPLQQRPHRASGSPTVSPQARQRGGSTPSTTARPIRRSRLVAQSAKLADACIRQHIIRETRSSTGDCIASGRRVSAIHAGGELVDRT